MTSPLRQTNASLREKRAVRAHPFPEIAPTTPGYGFGVEFGSTPAAVIARSKARSRKKGF